MPGRGRVDGRIHRLPARPRRAAGHAVDVGHGQLHPRLRSDPRVVVWEGVNARHLDARALPRAPDARDRRRVVHLAREGLARRRRLPRGPGGDRGPREAAVRGGPRPGGQGWGSPGVGGAPGGRPAASRPPRPRSGSAWAAWRRRCSAVRRGIARSSSTFARDLGARPAARGRPRSRPPWPSGRPGRSRPRCRAEGAGRRESAGRGRERRHAAHRGGGATGPGRGARTSCAGWSSGSTAHGREVVVDGETAGALAASGRDGRPSARSSPARSTSSSSWAATARSCPSRASSTAWTCPSSASTWAASAS